MKKLCITFATLSLLSTAYANTNMQEEQAPKATESKATKTKSDAEIMNALMTSNTEEMNLAKLGQKQASNPKVKEFADKMYKTHSNSNERATSLQKTENMQLVEDKTSMKTKSQTESSIEKLKGMKGKEFDTAYMDTEVKFHEKTLQNLDEKLIPNSANAQLKAMLETNKGNVQSHLEEARKIRSSIQ